MSFFPLPGLSAFSTQSAGKAKACIVLWMAGGPSQIDTFDPKPGTPTGGEFKAIGTSVPGIQICEHLPLLAKEMKDLAVIRSMTSEEANHDRARYFAHTGYAPAETIRDPSFGSIIAKRLNSRYASINGPALGAGILGEAFSPHVIHDPESATYDLNKGRYGNTRIGLGCLLARRLVENGVKFVEVEMEGWDTHEDNFKSTKRLLLELDPAFSSLIHDLRERGMLDTTLVVWMGEFGRTPQINRHAGRDHWPGSWCAVLAGGGIRGGQVVGATDAKGCEIVHDPVTIPELHATLCKCLGIHTGGKPVIALFS